MNTKGIRIYDIKNNKCVPMSDLLSNISDPDGFSWLLLWFNVTPIEGEGRFIFELIEKINHSVNGKEYTFKSLRELSEKIFQEIDVLIIGCKTKENLHRYKEDQQMYETCDIVIEMIDGGFWEIFSKNEILIHQLAKKYKRTEFISSDFQSK